MAKYYVDEEEMEEEEFLRRLEYETDEECEDNFNEYLDECEEEVKIFGETFSPSSILEELSPTTYRCMLADYKSEKLDEYKEELDCYKFVDVNHCYFVIDIEEEEEEENDA